MNSQHAGLACRLFIAYRAELNLAAQSPQTKHGHDSRMLDS